MSLIIRLSPAAQVALEAEASARNQSYEETASDLIDSFFLLHGVREEGYDAWFRAKVEEGLDAARNGMFASDEEVERRAQERRARLKAKIDSRK